MSDRDLSPKDLAALLKNFYYGTDASETVWERLAAAVTAAGLRPPARVIETVAELDALEAGTIVRGADGDVFRHSGGHASSSHEWEFFGGYDEWSRTADIALPVTVLWRPEVGGDG